MNIKRRKWARGITFILMAVLWLLTVSGEGFGAGFASQCAVQVDDLTVTNFQTGRKVVSYFGYVSGAQDVEYVPTVGTNPVGRFFTVLNGNTIKCSKIVNNLIELESTFNFQDNRSGIIAGSTYDVYPKTTFTHTSGLAYKEISGVPYLFTHESWGDSTPKYKEQIVYKCRIDYPNRLLRIEGAMVVTDSISGWPVAANGNPFNTVQEISGGTIAGDWLYSCEWSYNTTDTPYCHIFKTNINDCTNPGVHRPAHKTYATTDVNRLPYLLNQGITQVGDRWFLTRNPNGSGVYEVKINEDVNGNIMGINLAGQIAGERANEEEGCTPYGGDLVYFYNISGENHPAYWVKVSAQVRNELIEIPLSNFSDCQADYDDLRVYRNTTEIARVIASGKVKFLANNSGQGLTNPYPNYTIYYGDPSLGAPSYAQSEIDAINGASLSGNVNYLLEKPRFAYTDDFSNAGTMANYNVSDLGQVEAPSNWNIGSGYLNQLSNIYGPTTYGTQYPYERGTHLILKGIFSGNWNFSVKVKAGDNDGIGLVFGYQDSQNFYALEWDQQTSKMGFWKSVSQTDNGTVIAQVTSFPYTQGAWYNLRVEKRAATYKIYVNDTLKITATDVTFGTGRVGLLSRGSINLQYDDFAVMPVDAAYTDDFPNSATMANFNISDLGLTEAPSNWNIASGYLNQLSNIYGPTTNGTQYPFERGTHLILKGIYTGNWDLSVKVKAGDNDGIGLVFGYQNSQNFYALEWDQQTSKMGFWKSVNQTNNGTVIAQVTSYPYTQGVWYNVKIEKRSTTYKVYVNDVLKITALDAAFGTGRVGLLSRGSINLQYDDLGIIPVQ